MNQTKEILKQLENQYSDIGYYHTIVEKIEKNVVVNPDIAIESCKSLFEGLGKFIILKTDKSLSFQIVDNFKYKRAITKAVELLGRNDPEFEVEFAAKIIEVLEVIGNIRNDRGDVSHGRLAPKPVQSNSEFSNSIMSLTDSFASYLLISFSRIPKVKELQFDDNPEFNNWLDEEKEFGNLSYSKALFEQDIEEYKQELLSYKDLTKTPAWLNSLNKS